MDSLHFMPIKSIIKSLKKLRRRKPKPKQNYRDTVVGGVVEVSPRNIEGVFRIPARSHIAERIILSGNYENGVIEALETLQPPPGIMINVGANIGLIAVWLARKWQRKVMAIEPNPEAYEALVANVALNQLGALIEPVQACIGEQEGRVDFSIIEGKPEYSSVGGIVHHAVVGLPQKTIEVPVMPLDRLVMDQKVSLIFMDVEGAEGLFMRGGLSVIRRDHPIVALECSDRLLGKLGWTSERLAKEFEEMGYVLHPLDPKQELRHPFEGEVLCMPKQAS